MRTVTFCGHSELTASEAERLEKQLTQEIEKQVAEGATLFLSGGYGQFDRLCARVLKNLKSKYPQIHSVLVVPYIDREYDKTLYDESEYPMLEKVPKRLAILKRNEYMVNQADVVIAFVKHHFGGSAKTMEYARRKKKDIICL